MLAALNGASLHSTLWRPLFITMWFGACAATTGSLLSNGATVLRDK